MRHKCYCVHNLAVNNLLAQVTVSGIKPSHCKINNLPVSLFSFFPSSWTIVVIITHLLFRIPSLAYHLLEEEKGAADYSSPHFSLGKVESEDNDSEVSSILLYWWATDGILLPLMSREGISGAVFIPRKLLKGLIPEYSNNQKILYKCSVHSVNYLCTQNMYSSITTEGKA